MATQQVTETEAKTFADKLEAFGQRLSPKEQMLLVTILQRASSGGEDDVEGHHMMLDPMMIHTLVHLHQIVPLVVHQVSGIAVHAPHMMPVRPGR